MARKSTAFIRDEEDNVLRFEPVTGFMDGPEDSMDDVNHKVKAAQERLTQLRQQQEEIEREQKHLEELRQKQELFGSGKRDILEKLTRSTSSLDRELYDAQKLVEEISITRDTFSRHLEIIRNLQPEKWSRSQVEAELDNALTAIEDADEDYTKGIRRLSTCRRSETASAPETQEFQPFTSGPQSTPFANDDWNAWLRRGLAFTLPLIGTLIFALILIRLMF
jgi:vacuolar-type H+-ATPase subunit I/STV1